MNCFLVGSWRAVKSGFYTTIINNQLSKWTKKLQSIPKAKLAPKKKKVMVAVWWSAASLIHYSFLNPSKIITSDKYVQQISEMH